MLHFNKALMLYFLTINVLPCRILTVFRLHYNNEYMHIWLPFIGLSNILLHTDCIKSICESIWGWSRGQQFIVVTTSLLELASPFMACDQTSNWIAPWWPGWGEAGLPKACSLPEWKSLRRFRSPPSISRTSDTSVRNECCRGDDWTTLLGPAGWGARDFSFGGLVDGGKHSRGWSVFGQSVVSR